MSRSFVRDVARHGHDSAWLFGHKRTGFRYLAQHQSALLAEAQACVNACDPERAVTAFAAVPCLGLAKAGFLAQCLGLPVGCLDTHNIARFGLGRSDVRLEKTLSKASQAKRIAAYVRLCDDFGGAEDLWDSWCSYVAGRQLDLFEYADPFTVSEIHVTATQQWHS